MKPQAYLTVTIALLILFVLIQLTESDDIMNGILSFGQNLAKSMEDAIVSSLVGVLFFQGSAQMVFAGETATEPTIEHAPIKSSKPVMSAVDAAIATLESPKSSGKLTARLIDQAIAEQWELLESINPGIREKSEVAEQPEELIVESTPEVRAQTEQWIANVIEADEFLAPVEMVMEDEPADLAGSSVIQQEISWEFRVPKKSKKHSDIEVWAIVSGEPVQAGKLDQLLKQAKLEKVDLYRTLEATAPNLAIVCRNFQWKSQHSEADKALRDLVA